MLFAWLLELPNCDMALPYLPEEAVIYCFRNVVHVAARICSATAEIADYAMNAEID